MNSEQSVLKRLTETQTQMRSIFGQIAEREQPANGLDEATRGHIRNLDVRLEHLLNELSSGRDYAVQLARVLGADISESDREKILWKNAAKLLKQDR